MSSLPSTMRAMVLRRFGGPADIELAELPVPRPEPGEVLIRVATVAVNHQDLFTMSGRARRGASLAFSHVMATS